ncbi:uncharacterized protein [Palaemon carinicauda]|uniref:uncharacterized protein n=1 Tax=Palaemon carinicauda TaxID=392227 RepID=UPI0035B64870
MVIVGADLDGHVRSWNEAIGRVHGGHGIGERNPEGESVGDFTVSFDMTIVNTFFKKKREPLITYRSGGRCSQIDYFLYKRIKLVEVKNCKVIPKKESWCWSEEIEKFVKDKKEAKKRWEESQSKEDRERFREKKKVVKRILERMIDAKQREEVEIGKEQMRFMKGRGTKDGVFSLRQLMEKFREKQRDLHVVFFGLDKAYDRDPR